MIPVNNFSEINKNNGLINRSNKKDKDNNNKDSKIKCMLIKHKNLIEWEAYSKTISKKLSMKLRPM